MNIWILQPPVESVKLRDILDIIPSRTVILKIDIEGYECKVTNGYRFLRISSFRILLLGSSTRNNSEQGGEIHSVHFHWMDSSDECAGKFNWELSLLRLRWSIFRKWIHCRQSGYSAVLFVHNNENSLQEIFMKRLIGRPFSWTFSGSISLSAISRILITITSLIIQEHSGQTRHPC